MFGPPQCVTKDATARRHSEGREEKRMRGDSNLIFDTCEEVRRLVSKYMVLISRICLATKIWFPPFFLLTQLARPACNRGVPINEKHHLVIRM